MSRQVDVKALVSHIVHGDGADKCRICMGETGEGQMHLEDTVMMDGDKAVTLAELLEVITGVQVLVEDNLPVGLCSTCSKSTIDAANFRALSRSAATQWDKTITLLNLIPTFDSTNKKIVALLENDQIILINQDTESNKKTEKSTPYLDIVKDFKCPACNKQFQYANQLSQHLKESSDNVRACHVCGNVMQRNELITHLINTHHRDPFDCKKCPALFFSYNQYKVHLLSAHRSGSCTCGECGRRFQSQYAYNAHLSVHTPKICPGCDKLYRNQKCYQYHVQRCCNLDKTRSDTYHTKTKVTITVKKQNKDIKVGLRGSADTECICDYCKKKFKGKKFVAAHIQIVHMKNTHKPCIYCGKFLAAAHMTTHLKKHIITETYMCGHCGIVLKTKLGYSQHVRLHTGERPYKCKFCGEAFSASSRRSEHIRKCHKDPKADRHTCDKCPATFRLPYRLKKHISSVHGDGKQKLLQFECNECHQKFSSCRGLLHHSRTHQEGFEKRTAKAILLEKK